MPRTICPLRMSAYRCTFDGKGQTRNYGINLVYTAKRWLVSMTSLNNCVITSPPDILRVQLATPLCPCPACPPTVAPHPEQAGHNLRQVGGDLSAAVSLHQPREGLHSRLVLREGGRLGPGQQQRQHRLQRQPGTAERGGQHALMHHPRH